jgi:hypothetical protein
MKHSDESGLVTRFILDLVFKESYKLFESLVNTIAVIVFKKPISQRTRTGKGFIVEQQLGIISNLRLYSIQQTTQIGR